MLTLRGLTFDAAAPRIIVPLFARSLGALRPLAAAADADPAAEVVELRLDPLPEVDFSAALALVRSLTDKPLIVTIRTKAEGGELALMPDTYAAHCRALLAQGGVDALDIEWKACGPHRDALRNAARAAGAAALYSEHHFDGTPAADAARLLEATARAHAARPGVPLITMSMGAIGAVTRFCGGAFGSAATFGVTSGTTASAPGQPSAEVLKEKLFVSGQ